MKTRPACETCPFWNESAKACQRYAPRHKFDNSTGEGMPDWAPVFKGDWCGEHPDFDAWIKSTRIRPRAPIPPDVVACSACGRTWIYSDTDEGLRCQRKIIEETGRCAACALKQVEKGTTIAVPLECEHPDCSEEAIWFCQREGEQVWSLCGRHLRDVIGVEVPEPLTDADYDGRPKTRRRIARSIIAGGARGGVAVDVTTTSKPPGRKVDDEKERS